MPLDQDPNAQSGDKDQGQGDSPKYVTEEQLNKAITNRLKTFGDSFKKDLTGSISETIKGLTSEIDSALDAKLQPLMASAGGNAGAKSGKDASHDKQSVDIDAHPVVKGMQRQLEEQKRALDKAQADAATERQKVLDRDLRSKLADALGAAGVKDPTRLRHAVGSLVDSDKRVRWSEDGDALVYHDPDDGPVDLATGLKGWAKTEDAKLFLAPIGAQGSGDKSGGKSPNAGGRRSYVPGSFGQELAASVPGMNITIGPRAAAK